MDSRLISVMIFAPLVGALLQAVLPGAGKEKTQKSDTADSSNKLARSVAFAASMIGSLVALVLALALQAQGPSAHIGMSQPWVESYAITYDVSLDGLNVLLVLLVAIVFPTLIAAEWKRKSGVRGMHGLLLILQTAFFGALCAQDLFIQFFFWALSALPFYFLISIWGGKNRESAASHAMAASSIGNAFIFAALILVYYSMDPHSFSFKELAGAKFNSKMLGIGGVELPVGTVAFALAGLGLAVRAPIWPFHGWFIEVAREAPASVFVAYSGVSVPVATYIFIKICCTLFPETLGQVVGWIQLIGILSLLICALNALAQKELRTLMAFFCLSQTGLILLGVGSLSSPGIVGAFYQQLTLGIALAGFGFFAGIVEDRIGHDRFAVLPGDERGVISGLVAKAPAISMFSGILLASLLGFPGLGGFVGQAMLVIGSYTIHPLVVLLIAAALLLGVYCLFNMYRQVFFGDGAALHGASRGPGSEDGFADIDFREKAYLLPLAAALLFFGLYPTPLIEMVRPAVLTLLSAVK